MALADPPTLRSRLAPSFCSSCSATPTCADSILAIWERPGLSHDAFVVVCRLSSATKCHHQVGVIDGEG